MALNTLAHEGPGGKLVLTLKKNQPPAPIDRSPQPRIEPEKHSAPLSAIQAFEAALWAARNSWDVERRRGGLFGTRVLKRDEAERALRLALAEIGGVE